MGDSRLVIVLATALLHAVASQSHLIEVNITVPEFKIETEDAYLCVAAQLPPHPHKLVGVIPHARQEVVHHILLYGCAEPRMAPGPDGKAVAWRCDMQPVCNGPSSEILYGWGRNAPDLRLPEGVGFSVGERTGVRYVVAQVHYLAVRPPDDRSGVTLVLKPHAVPYAAGLVSFASWFTLPPGKKSHVIDNTCCFKSYQPLTVFAARVHTHTLGRNVTMKRQAWNHSGVEVLVARDPQLPQSFVPQHSHVLWPGDRLTVTCDYDTTSRKDPINAGGTHNDEMCNMYVMVYGKTSYITMCSNNQADIRDDSPGALPRGATVIPDPTPFWKPPAPEGTPGDKAGAFGDVTSVTAAPDGTLWVLYRASGVWNADTFDAENRITRKEPIPEAVVARVDPDTGAVLARWGAGLFYVPHMITADAQGNVWIADVGRHQVMKFTPNGTLIQSLGSSMTPGYGKSHFCKPAQVSVLRDGSFLVADGYCNKRVQWFDPDGKFIAESGDIAPVVHSVLVDECEGLVYVASREHGQVLALSLGDKDRLALRATYDMAAAGHGQVWALKFGPYGEQLVLTWTQGTDAKLVNVKFPAQYWSLPGTANLSPHDFVLGGAAPALTGAGDRLFAVFVASVGVACDKACGPLHKFVLLAPGTKLPTLAEMAENEARMKEVHPGEAVEMPHGTVTAAHKANGNNATDAKGDDDKDDEGGAMVADDYDEDVEGDAEDAEDYEKEAEEKEKEEEEVEEEIEIEEEAEADYEEAITGVRPNVTHTSQHVTAAPAPLQKDRFEVLVQDKDC
ncbi:hypothetical protein GPECTOR_12g561 [Gonium pectorale]|uniref:Peptidylglycine monooxygenase n=1 Tax=Gonium pectorale TaxID=33097 RepID=A0A150GP44_GONPE|nr:hypothetical protein GPECTOR_12g561 [Gonium pectorale]|eukprot:KXZ51597.1 hypothetical protein GPECTOR_12g561 [Gonium pectorale]